MSDVVMVSLITGIPATLGMILAFITTIITRSSRNDVRLLEKNTNSMKDALVKLTGESEHAKGVIQGAAEEKAAGVAGVAQRREEPQL